MRAEHIIKRLELGSPISSAWQFRWPRKVGGYEIVKGYWPDDIRRIKKPRPVPCIAETAAARETEAEWYDPAAENSALFQEVADTDMSTESLLTFSNRWGLPYGPLAKIVPGKLSELALRTRNDLERAASPVFLLAQGRDHSLEFLGQTVRAWRLLGLESASAIRSAFRRDPKGGWIYVDHVPGGDGLWHLGQGAADRGDFADVLMDIVQDRTNVGLGHGCSPALLRDPKSGEFQLRMVPSDLRGFLWVQFAQAVSGGKKFRQCESCARWMEITPDNGRPDKTYCSDACRMRAYRQRKGGH